MDGSSRSGCAPAKEHLHRVSACGLAFGCFRVGFSILAAVELFTKNQLLCLAISSRPALSYIEKRAVVYILASITNDPTIVYHYTHRSKTSNDTLSIRSLNITYHRLPPIPRGQRPPPIY